MHLNLHHQHYANIEATTKGKKPSSPYPELLSHVDLFPHSGSFTTLGVLNAPEHTTS